MVDLQFYDMRMTKEFQILDLSTYLPDNVEALDFLTVQNLDGDL